MQDINCDLKDRLDLAAGAQEMMEEITERNLDQGEKISELKAAVADLEALRELNEELEEDRIEAEKALNQEIGRHANSKLRALS